MAELCPTCGSPNIIIRGILGETNYYRVATELTPGLCADQFHSGVASEPAPTPAPVWDECVGSHDEAEPAVERPTEANWEKRARVSIERDPSQKRIAELESELSSLRLSLAGADASIVEYKQQVEELKAALRHQRYRYHEYSNGCDGCTLADKFVGTEEGNRG